MIRPLFKVHEPFMEVPKGHGYLGVMMYDDKEDRIQCHICGKWVKMVAQHANKSHGITGEEYRAKFSLPLRGGLLSHSANKNFSARAMSDDNMAQLKRMRKNAKLLHSNSTELMRTHTKRVRRCFAAHNRLASKNRIGLCPAQMQARFDVVRAIVKRNPANMDVLKYDKKLYEAMRRQGGVDLWRKKNGITLFPKKKQAVYENLDIVAALRKWSQKEKRTPSMSAWMGSDNRPSASTICRAFGSWRNALLTSGLS